MLANHIERKGQTDQSNEDEKYMSMTTMDHVPIKLSNVDIDKPMNTE